MASADTRSTFEAAYVRQDHATEAALQRASAHHGILALPDLQLAAAHASEAAGTANCASMLGSSRDYTKWATRRADSRRLVTRLNNDIITLVADCLRSAA